ncbi:RpiB/LacA/LacB family sugar-phosphate isomerase [archaeon]|nr:RpiB/LacA/LacB family sugar-phosphate isomerase [archaeon]
MRKLRIAIGSDKDGYATKRAIMEYLDREECVYTDFGVNMADDGISSSVIADYVARAVSSGEYERGIIIDRFGIITTMAANRVEGVRAVSTVLMPVAEKSVEYYNANTLCIAADINMGDKPEDIVNIWLKAKFRK